MSDGVLLVEDDPDLRQDLAFLIEAKTSHKVATAANGKAALEALLGPEASRPCVILLDLMMPVMDGWELRQRLLEDDDLANIPVIVISGVDDVAQEAGLLKAVGHLSKPVDLDRLYGFVDTYC